MAISLDILVVEFACRLVALVGMPVQTRPAVGSRLGDEVIEQGFADSSSACRFIEEQILQIADRLLHPCRLMHEADGEADHLAIQDRHPHEQRRCRIDDPRPGGGRHVLRHGNPVEGDITSPEPAPIGFVTWRCIAYFYRHGPSLPLRLFTGFVEQPDGFVRKSDRG